MKVAILFLVACAILGVYAWDDESKLKLAITEKGAEQIKNDSLPFIIYQLMTADIPDVTGTDDMTLCNVKYEFTHIHLVSLNIPGGDPITFIPGNQSFAVPLSNVEALVSLKWHYNCLVASGTGHADIKLILDIGDRIGIFSDDGIPQLNMYAIHVQITHMSIKVEGDAGSFLQWLLSTFQSRVKKALQTDLENEFKNNIVPQINGYLMNGNYRIPMEGGLKMDAYLDKEPVFESGFVEFSSQATFEEPEKGPVICPSILILPISDRPSNNPLFGFVSQYFLNCYSISLYHVGFYQINITNKDIPSVSPVHLYTNDSIIDSFVPQLNQVYPNQEMKLSVMAKEHPTVLITPGNVTLTANILLDFIVLDPKEEVSAFVLDLDTQSVLDVYVKDSTISGKIVDVKHNLTIESSNIGQLKVDDVDNLMSFVISFMLEPTINTLLKKGIAIPTVGPLTILEADLYLGDQFFEVQVEKFLWVLSNTTMTTEEYVPISIM